MYILSYPYGLTLAFLRVKLSEPVITLFISINESKVKHVLLSESIKLFFMQINSFFNLSKLISLITCHCHLYSSYSASSKSSCE